MYDNNTQNLTNGSTPDPFKDPFIIKIDYIYFYSLAIVIWSGLLLNTLSIVCFLTSKLLKRSTTGNYLIALSSADSIFLLGDLLRWLNIYINEKQYTGITIHDDYHFWCTVTYYLRYFGKLASAWVTVAITFERYISIRYPFNAGFISTKRNTRIVIVGVYICCAALTLFPFWTIGLTFDEDENGVWSWCAHVDTHQYIRWNWAINAFGSLFIPSIILFIVTVMIIFKLTEMSRQRRRLMGQDRTNPIERQLTCILIVVVVAFLLLRLPYAVCYYLWMNRKYIWSPVTTLISHATYTAYKLSDVLASSNYAVNFYLYCFAGSTFREQFLALLCCRSRRPNNKRAAGYTLTTSLRSLNRLTPTLNRKINGQTVV